MADPELTRAHGVDPVMGLARRLAVGLALLASSAAAASLDREAVLRVIRSRQTHYQQCYQQALARTPRLTGRLTLRFTVERDGRVSAVREVGEPSFPDATMSRCVIDEFRRLRFPALPAQIHIIYPLQFAP